MHKKNLISSSFFFNLVKLLTISSFSSIINGTMFIFLQILICILYKYGGQNMDLIKFRAVTIVLMAITAIISTKNDNLPILFGNIIVILLINKAVKLQLLFLLCMYSFICVLLSVDYIREKKRIILYLLYVAIVITHLIQLVSVINIFFSTI